jgi:hypothetical protein
MDEDWPEKSRCSHDLASRRTAVDVGLMGFRHEIQAWNFIRSLLPNQNAHPERQHLPDHVNADADGHVYVIRKGREYMGQDGYLK